MASRFFTIGALAVLTTMAAVAAVSSPATSAFAAGGRTGQPRICTLFGSRSAQQRRSAAGAKFDGALADLSRHAARGAPDHAIEDLRSLAPAVRFKQTAPMRRRWCSSTP